MDDFCHKDKFWDPELTWNNNSWPELTECFENTALIWPLCGYLLLIAPVYILYLTKSKPLGTSNYTRVSILKQLFSILMIICLAVELINSAYQSSQFNEEILSYAAWIVLLILHIFLVHLERTKCLHYFYVLFGFWLLGSMALLVQLYSAVQKKIYEAVPLHFTMLIARFLLSVLLFLIHCLRSDTGIKAKNKDDPYANASLLSMMFMTWMEPLVIKGAKKPLQNEDLYNLPAGNTTFNLMRKFQRTWDRQKKRSKSERKRVTKKLPVEHIDMCDIPLQSHLQEEKTEVDKTEKREEYVQCPRASFTKAMMKNFWIEVIKTEFPMLVRIVDNVVTPLVLGFFIDYISNQELTWHGFIYTAAILLLKVFTITTAYPSAYEVALLALKLQSAIMGSVFRKSLTISSEARKQSTTGEIVNLMSVDSSAVRNLGEYFFWFWMCILYFIIGICLTWSIVGVSVISGIGFILIILLMNLFILDKLRLCQDSIMEVKDERVKIINEILNGIKVIKLYGWEKIFMEKIVSIREKELKILLKMSILEAFFNFAWRGALFWMNYFILVTYVMTDDEHYLTAKTAFVTLSYIGLVRLAVNISPIVGQNIIKASTSFRRLNKFMNEEDISLANLERDTTDSLSVRIENADFAWEKQGNITLKNIDVEVTPGKLIAVVGTVGAGKSSLLSGMLGEMHKIKGYVNLNSSVAYVPQVAWIQNASVKNNILFGSPLRQESYEAVIANCCLEADLKIMAAGDGTEIGEKGINLSGGQKQRISLARAVYSQADIYLLDDPLSAVDSHVGRHIFDQVIGPNGCLQGKTRILVTHGVQWLPEVDQILVMSNGEISESGTMDELLTQNGDFAKFLTQYFIQHGELAGDKVEEMDKYNVVKKDILQRLISVTSDSDASDIQVREVNEIQRLLSSEISEDVDNSLIGSSAFLRPDIKLSHTSLHRINNEMDRSKVVDQTVGEKPDASRLTTDEGAAGGRVSMKMYWHLWKGVGHMYSSIIAVFIIIYHISYNYANYWIAEWTDDHDLSNFTEFPANSTGRLDRNTQFIVAYTVIGLIQTVTVFIFSFLLFIRHVAACRKLHAELLESVMKAPMSFFDMTPIGRILNRFSQDITDIDGELFYDLCDVIDFFFKGVGVLVMISYTLPWFLAVILPVLFLVFVVQRLFIVSSCQARRLNSNRQSPIFAHFSETLSGVSVIRAYRAQDQFIAESDFKIDNCQQAASMTRALNRWLHSRLDTVAFIVVGSVCIFACVTRDDLTPGVIGLTVSYAIEMSVILCIGFELLGMLETRLVSVERVREYSVIKSEAAWTLSEDSSLTLSPPTRDLWPSAGNIDFVNYSTRYREGLDLVLEDITCTIHGGEKVGIVGRTGAGKSSMVLSLFRLIEAVEGRVIIDGVDISTIGLHTLRHNISILPQDPVLFAGTLRMNIDPRNEKTDSEIWTALEHSHLKNFVLGLDNKLNHNVGESGENLSLGQRQLLCLARTLLRKTKILVLDEATASVDMDTDDLIQKTIRTEFKDCTVLTIAHRLNTVIDYDKIMVLDSGKIAELESPSTLLADPESKFYSMAKEAGLVGAGNES